MGLKKSLFVSAALISLGACQNSGGGLTESVSKYDVNRYAVNNTVCNPLDGGGTAPSTDPNQGIQATLWYLQPNQTIYHDVESMINNGTKSDRNLFFNNIFVPTRYFTEGFPSQSGASVTDNQGNVLLQYFALRFNGVIQLGPNDPEGDYQLGMLADDGVILSMALDSESPTNYQVVLNDDGDHPTQMGCGQTIHMTKNSAIPFQLDYYQGPMYEIALVPLWRLVNSCTTTEHLCGVNGNYTYFNPTGGSTPEPDYNVLLADGWQPLTSDNYAIPQTASYNPCTSGTAPQISNVQVTNDSEEGFFVVTWTTDIPATDQVLVTNTGTGAQTLTTSDNVLRTSHSIEVPGLLPGVNYTVQAVSISADLGKTVSAPVAVNYE